MEATMPDKAPLLMRAALLKGQLDVFYAALVTSSTIDDDPDVIDPAIHEILAPSLCRLSKLIVPDIHQKVDEIVYAAENDLEVSPLQHGADLIDKANNHHELKVSICKAPRHRCNIDWHIPKAETPETRREKLLASIKEKVRGGGATLIIRNGKGKQLARYTLSESFLLGYFERVKLGKSDVHNMGCSLCMKCKTFHRLDKLQRASDLLNSSDNNELPGAEWEAVFTPEKPCKE